MSRRFLLKVLTLGALFFLLQVPLSMIEGLVAERAFYRQQAKSGIAQSWTGEQSVIGPVLVVPYQEHVERQVWDENLKAYRSEEHELRKTLFILPDELRIHGEVGTEERKRGLYSVPVYSSELLVAGRFDNAPLLDLLENSEHDIRLEPAFVSVVISDLRGISEHPRLAWLGKDRDFHAGSRCFPQLGGMHALVGEIDTQQPQSYEFATRLALRGMERIQFSPFGRDTEVELSSPWPHPSFVGRYLPREHGIDSAGFTALWKASSFSGDLLGAVQGCRQGQCAALQEEVFGVSFVTPVDIYQQTERSVKYAVLFIGLSFVAFFLFELMRGLRLHPMHYLLVGLELAVFYLLLLSLSEHLGFGASYIAATLASTGLLGFYLSGILADRLLAMGFSAKLLLLYGMLYGILLSEDNALLMGSLLLFAALGLIMTVTRRLDWYAVGEPLGRDLWGRKKPVEAAAPSAP